MYKVTMKGYLEFGLEKTYTKIYTQFLQRREVLYKNDLLVKELEGWREEEFRYVVPKQVLRNVTERCWKNTISMLENMASFALSGQVYIWITKEDGKESEFYCIEPKNDKQSVSSYLKGALLMQDGQPAEAVEYLSQAIEKFAQHGMAYELRGRAQLMLGNEQDALLDFTRSIEFCPMHPDAFTGRAEILLTQGNHDHAIADAEEALAWSVPAQQVHWEARRIKGAALFALQEFDGAIFELNLFTKRIFAENDPNKAHLAEAWRMLGHALLAKDKIVEGTKALETAENLGKKAVADGALYPV